MARLRWSDVHEGIIYGRTLSEVRPRYRILEDGSAYRLEYLKPARQGGRFWCKVAGTYADIRAAKSAAQGGKTNAL